MYVGEELHHLFDPGLADDACHQMAHVGGEFLYHRVVENTPVGFHNTTLMIQGFGVARAPGTLRRSWYMLPVARHRGGTNGGYEREVATDDPIAPFVENDTRPHDIRPKSPGGMLRFRVWPTGALVFSKLVRHPGTTGQHMMLTAANATQIAYEEVCQPVLDRWVTRAYERLRAANRV